MTDLKELIERVEKANGPDRELGRELLLAGGWSKHLYGHFLGPLYMWSSPDRSITFKDDDFRDHDPTAFIDAALALTERVLPGKWWPILDDAATYLWATRQTVSPPVSQLPLAIVLATLRALQEQEK